MNCGLFREDGQIWGWFVHLGPVNLQWLRPAAREDMPIGIWLWTLHLRDSDSWLWMRAIGLELNISRETR